MKDWEVLQRAKGKCVQFNQIKCIFGRNKVKYVDHYFSEKGIKVNKSM